jgi:hypothetical protein
MAVTKVPAPAPPLLYLLRGTKYLPRFRGLSFLLRCYRGIFPAGALARIHDFDGDLSLEVNICETIGINLWHAPRHYERLERKLFFAALKPRCTILDVGANIGIYSLLASKRKAHVIAIEADPINVKALWHNLKRNRLTDRVDVWPLRIGRRLSLYIAIPSILVPLRFTDKAKESRFKGGPSIH